MGEQLSSVLSSISSARNAVSSWFVIVLDGGVDQPVRSAKACTTVEALAQQPS